MRQMIQEAYMHKENRDRRAKELQAQGYARVRRYSYRNQLVNPKYVKDFPYTGDKVQFTALYIVEAESLKDLDQGG